MTFNFLDGTGEPSVVDIKAMIVARTLDEAPNIHTVPVSKTLSAVQIISNTLADDELSDDEKRLLDSVFTSAFSQPD
jgi:hypothetical protein